MAICGLSLRWLCVRSALLTLAVACSLAAVPGAAGQPLTTVFSFHGELASNAAPATGTFDLSFRLFDAASAGTQLGSTPCVNNVTVTNGKFVTRLDFHNQFAGEQRFREVLVGADSCPAPARTPGPRPTTCKLKLTKPARKKALIGRPKPSQGPRATACIQAKSSVRQQQPRLKTLAHAPMRMRWRCLCSKGALSCNSVPAPARASTRVGAGRLWGATTSQPDRMQPGVW